MNLNEVDRNNDYKKMVYLSIIFYALVVVVNYLSAMGFIAGNSQSDVSASFPTMITPAGFAFSIWGVIYLFVLISILSPLFKKNDLNVESIKGISKLFWISVIVNVAWTFVFSFKIIWLSAILIVALFINILTILVKLKTIRGNEKGFFDIGFGLYGGWLSIASVVNFVAFLVSINFNFFGNEKLFSTIVLAVFVVVALSLQKIHTNPFFNLSIAWAYFGIINRASFETYTEPMFLVLAVGIVLLLISSFSDFRKMKFKM